MIVAHLDCENAPNNHPTPVARHEIVKEKAEYGGITSRAKRDPTQVLNSFV